MTINGSNVYQANRAIDEGNNLLSDGYFERYTGYQYAVGYGNLLGGADPVRMFAHYQFNPNDLKTGDTITFTIGDQTAEYPTADVKEIQIVDEILQLEDDFETAQMLAAFKWRLDDAVKSFDIIGDPVDEIYGTGREMFTTYGSSFARMSSSMMSRFAPNSPGISIGKRPDGATPPEERAVDYLPVFDEARIEAVYPEIAEYLPTFIANYHELASMIAVTTNGRDAQYQAAVAVEAKMHTILDEYHAMCDALGMDYLNLKSF